jgi:hypothetical protein
LLTLIEACLEKQAKARPAPNRIIEFCVARAPETADSSQPWRGWSLADAGPEPSAGNATVNIGGGNGRNTGDEPVDGNLGTRWSSAWSDPQWLKVDLGATHAVRKVVLVWEHAYATAFQIQISVNGTTWTDIYSTTTGAGGDQPIHVSGTGRYVRLYGTHRVSNYGYALWEFQVFGD